MKKSLLPTGDSVPRMISSSTPEVSANPIASHAGPRLAGGKRILLADDDAVVRTSISDVLDLNMPVKNGWDTFERLTNSHPLVPIIIITARPNQLFLATAAGVGALLEKPFDMSLLLRTMDRLLAEPAKVRMARLAGGKAPIFSAATVAGGDGEVH
jgi:hypothetical protein